MKTSADCRDTSARRRDLRRHTTYGVPDLNGLDYLEVNDTQTVLTVYFLAKAPEGLTENNVRIDGGTRVRNIRVVPNGLHLCEQSDPRVDDCMQLTVDRPGDFSTYTLRLVNTDEQGRPTDQPLDGFDPFYAQLDFTFKAGCPSDLDCAPQKLCPPATGDDAEINYLAKDYSSFRQLILDRLALLMPDWTERHVPDLGITLAELMAYVGDHLSYYQDAVATEAYLNTARQRISVRRHTRLVDYHLHEGCNARAWLFIETDIDYFSAKVDEVFFITGHDDGQAIAPRMLTAEDLRRIPTGSYEVFEPLVQPHVESIEVYKAHNRISFYTWGNRNCCLPRGATSATLKDAWANHGDDGPEQEDEGNKYISPGHEAKHGPVKGEDTSGQARTEDKRKALSYSGPAREQQDAQQDEPATDERLLKLKPGDVLIFEEVLGPITGQQADADPTHRHAVRLTKVEPGLDQLYDQPIVEIEWAIEDALPFALCISATGRAPECLYLEDVSIARGNVILVDHGQRVSPPLAWYVTAADEPVPGCDAPGEPFEAEPPSGTTPRRFTRMSYRLPLPEPVPDAEPQKQPVLPAVPLTFRAPFPAPAAIARGQGLLLSGLKGAVRKRLTEIWTRIRGGGTPTDAELAELRTILGARALADAGLDPKGRSYKRQASAAEQLAALERLLAQTDELLMKKERRLGVLIERTRAGYVLGDLEEDELAEMFGAKLAVNLSPDNNQLLGPAALALEQNPREALPDMTLSELSVIEILDQQGAALSPTLFSEAAWTAQPDLLDSDPSDRHFVVEIDNEGLAHLRFGKDDCGRAPVPGTILRASYRVGKGIGGNVGAEGISQIVFRQQLPGDVNLSVRNPLPARGGAEQEEMAEAKLLAPVAFGQELQRAVTSEDYALLAERSEVTKIQRAAAPSFRWNGSWYEARVAVDPLDTDEVDEELLAQLTGYLYPYRRIGHDLEVQPARYVSLDLGLRVCVLPQYLRGHVEAAILDLFSNRALPGNRYGLFHPNNLSFGQSVYVSRLVAAAQAVEGVQSASVYRLQRLYEQPNHEIEKGRLALGPLEIARLDNDPNFPERGKLKLDMRGGR